MVHSKSFARALYVVCLVAMFSLASASTSTSARTEVPSPIAVIPLLPYVGPQLALKVRAHGRDGLMLFDTGGGVTIVTPGFADALGCKPWGQITGFRMQGDRVDTPRCDNATLAVGGLSLSVPSAGVFDFSKFVPKDAPPLDGSLALDAFAGHAVTIDMSGRQLIVESAASLKARVRGATEVPVRFNRDVEGLALSPVVAIETSQGRLWMELDTGSDGTVIAGRHAAEALGLDSKESHGQSLTLTLAGGVSIHTRAIVRDLILDGNIGVPVLANWVITLDLAQQRLWMAPSGGA